jgi:hypothetical protein
VNDDAQTFTLGGVTVSAGDYISLNGNTGEVILGKAPLAPAEMAGDLNLFMGWVDEYRTLKVGVGLRLYKRTGLRLYQSTGVRAFMRVCRRMGLYASLWV